MWHPPARIRHALLPEAWPSAERAARSPLYEPIGLGHIVLAERTWVPAMVPWRADAEGFVTDEVLRWYERFARGRPGAIVVEATGIRDVPSGPLLRIGHDRFVAGLARLVDAVRRASGGRTRLFIQIIDFLAIRRRPPRARFFERYLRIDDRLREVLREVATGDAEVRAHLAALPDAELERLLPERQLESLRYGHRERVTDMDLPHVRTLPAELPEVFAAAAARARRAGFDGVELHYAHAYTMASFLSARNTRPDGYGGSRAGRLRLPREVLGAVRARVGSDLAVGCRMLADECIAGGSTVDDACHFAVELARDGLDFVSLSRGGKFEDAAQPPVGWAAYPYTGPSGYECMPTTISDGRGPFGRNLEATAAVRRALRSAGLATPVVAAGGIATFSQAEAILSGGVADICASARQSLADPDWFLKVRLGRGAEVRRCTYTNYCEGLDQKHKQVTCKLWDRTDAGAPGVSMAADGRRRLVAPPWS